MADEPVHALELDAAEDADEQEQQVADQADRRPDRRHHEPSVPRPPVSGSRDLLIIP